MKAISKVLIVGGTHGNEWTGIYAVKKYAAQFKAAYPSLDTHCILANPEAFKINRRFKDEDLNRAFQFLHEERPSSYEHGRAKELKAQIDKETCFVLDLHTTTTNMGNTIIISHDEPLNFAVAQKLTEHMPSCRVIYSPDPNRKYLASQSNYGLMIEVGPVPNGVLRADMLENTLKIINEVLRALSNSKDLQSGKVEIYEEIEDIHYPKDDSGELMGYIHPSFQDQDFNPIFGSYTPFMSFSGEEIELETKEELFPIFINEAAYYPTRLAYTLCRKRIHSF